MQLADFDFTLPEALIARYPLSERSQSRLFCLEKNTQQHKHFYDVIHLIQPGDCLILNDTKVMAARLFGHKATGGRVEVLVERVLDDQHILAQVKASKIPQMDSELFFDDGIRLKVLDKNASFYTLCYPQQDRTVLQIIEKIGHIPLPPYMQREADEQDKIRYQTVYARHQGSVAAPTAGLHFDQALLQQLREKNVDIASLTLHIGAGTFAPVRVDDITSHQMHAEYIEVSSELCAQIKATKARGGRIIAVGTTTLRALETASRSGEIMPFAGDTRIFIYPGFTFNCVDALITNFHLPRSTLLMLISAFAGYEKVMNAYQEAVQQAYRFYSYGDAMWLER